MPKPKTQPLPHARDAVLLALLIAAQMLPATLISPAIRPLFATWHGGAEGPMHAFMALNMLGGVLSAPFLARLGNRLQRPMRLASALAASNALLMWAMAQPLPTAAILGLRVLDGAAHISASTLLMLEAAKYKPVLGSGRAMGLAGGGIMLAIAFGSGIGGVLLEISITAPFFAGAVLSAFVGALLFLRPTLQSQEPSRPAHGRLSPWRLVAPISAAFVERFSIGCLIVTFSLFAHRGHGLTDSAIGMLFAAFTVPFALLMYPIGRLTDSLPRSMMLAVGGVTYATSLAALGYSPTDTLWIPMFVGGCASALMFSPTLSYVVSLTEPASRGRAMAWVNAAGCLGMLLGPAAAGATSSAFASSGDPLTRYRAVFWLAAATVAVWTALFSRWMTRRFRAEREELRAEAAGAASATPALAPQVAHGSV